MSRWAYGALVFASGFAALIYEVAWQRGLHTLLGTSSEAAAIIVSTFMCGLGIGAAAGGEIATRFPTRLVRAFVLCELTTSLIGATSLGLLHALAAHPLGTALTSVIGIAPPLVATACMGASLPVLASYALRYDRLPGPAVARFYFINTLGAAAGSFATVLVLFEVLGLSGSVFLAAAINFSVAMTAASRGEK